MSDMLDKNLILKCCVAVIKKNTIAIANGLGQQSHTHT